MLTGVSAMARDTASMNVTLGTATVGGGVQLFGRNLAEVIGTVDSGAAVDAGATRGSQQNLTLLEEGGIEIGPVEGNAARQALDGVGRPRADLRVLAVM